MHNPTHVSRPSRQSPHKQPAHPPQQAQQDQVGVLAVNAVPRVGCVVGARALLADEAHDLVLPLPRLTAVAEDDLRQGVVCMVTVRLGVGSGWKEGGRPSAACRASSSARRRHQPLPHLKLPPRAATPEPTSRCCHSGSQASFCSKKVRRWALSRAMNAVPGCGAAAGRQASRWREGAGGDVVQGRGSMSYLQGNRRSIEGLPSHAHNTKPTTPPTSPSTHSDDIPVERWCWRNHRAGAAHLSFHLAPHLRKRPGLD